MSENPASARPVSSTPTTLAAPRKKKPDFQDCLKQYATAALGMASVGALASAQTPGHHIFYTPANTTIDTHSGVANFIQLDFNHDGVTDVILSAHHFTDFFSGGIGFAGYGRITLLIGSQSSAITSKAIAKGIVIDKAGKFQPGSQTIAYAGTFSYMGDKHTTAQGAFVNVKNKYLGLHFLIDGKLHEGWIRLSLSTTGDHISGTITGYAYDTVPRERGLAAGQINGSVGPAEAATTAAVKNAVPGSLGML